MDPTHQTLNLFITYVDKEGPFLKVWGQAEKNNSIYVEQFLLGASQSFETGIGKIPFETLQVGTLVCAKYKDNKYYRARIVTIDYLNESFVEVNFLDYGNKDIVPSENIRSLQNFPPSFISIPPLATGFIFAEAHCPGGGEWKEQIFEIISKELRYREVQCHLLTQATQYYLIRLYIDNTDIGALFINRGLMQPIPLHAQQAVLLSMSMQRKAPTPPAPAPAPAEINTFKACTLEQNQQYAVYVSFVNEGPTHFSVQLQQSEQMLAKLMKEINEINMRMLEEVPLPGTICLARCQEDGNVCRAVVTNEVDNQFKVFYVDFGNYETLPLEALYQIPFKYVLPKVMAIRLSLNGVEKSTVTLEMLLAFKKFVDNRLLYMKVLPSLKKIAIPKCELWDPAAKTSALDVINRAAQHAYPEPLLLSRGFTQPVKVSYVFSCNRFFVQLVSKEQELCKLMEDLQISCQLSEYIEDIKIGLPCCALYEVDLLWYRSEIVDVVDKENVKVRYIDFGNEEPVPVANLRMVEGELLTVLRPQAIECCLSGYQNMGPDETRDNLLEELILEQNFTMKVSEMLEKKALVELIDTNNYNVASLLLEKIAASKSQVSPMLVQAGNKIEHRKSSSDSSDNFKGQQKRTARDLNKDWNNRNDGRNSERTNEKSWRNDTKDNRQNDINSNGASPDGGSWRQNNKGFNQNNDRNDRGERNQRGDRPNINDRFNRNKTDRDNDKWNKKDNGHPVTADSWSSPATDAPPPVADDWETSSPIRTDDFRAPKNDRFGENKKRFDKSDRGEGGSKGDWGDRGNKGDRGGEQGKMRGGWQNTDGFKSDGFKSDGFKKDGFKKDFKKDGSEMSSSGSEKSFKKGPRTSSRNDRGGGKFQNRSNNSFANTTVNDSWSVSDVSTPIDAAPNNATFEQQQVVGTEAAVVISWFHNPGHFYCQLQTAQAEFRTLMEEIQQFYKNRKPETCKVGAPIIGLFPEDNVLYRAQVMESLGDQFKVFYVDFGNVSTISKVWPIEKKFMNMPAQAICSGLSGIVPNGDDWPEASTFGKWFQKDLYVARFLEKDETRTHLQLWDGQEEISQLLVQENLALPAVTQPSSADIEVSFLLSQQFRVVLKSVNNLSDVIVALECGLALNCKAHNIEMASESYEDVLKAYLEQMLIVYVDNVLENNVLDVTFYDNEGNKLVILEPDEGALDNVEPLCPLLIISSQIYGYVSHADETSVFIQPSEYAEQIATLLERMYEIYENMTEEASIIPEEDFVYAVHSEDGNWYRGRVTSFDDDKAAITYVDYGNSESVGFSALRELQSEFNISNMMCLQVTVTTGSAQSFLEKDVAVSIYYGESGWEGAVEEYAQAANEGAPAAESLPKDGESLHEDGTLVQETIQAQEGLAEAVEEPVQEVLDQHATAGEAPNVVAQKGTPVFVSHIDSPTQFYVQFAESETALTELQQILQDMGDEMPVLETITVGALCAAPYSVDHQWYRAEVLDADDDITTVRFVDFGNTDVINNANTQIKTLPTNLLTPAIYAARCSLKLEAVQEEWSQQALELFESLANQENVVAEFIVQDEKTNIVELYVNGACIKDALLEQNLAVPCEIVTESKTTCFVSHLNSPSEFWVQMENCVDELEWIAEQLSGAELFQELEDMTPGTLCGALFPDDEMWYRARILSNTIAGIELLFIDYGNSCVSSSLRQLPEELLITAPLAQKCCLQKPEGIPYWTKEAQNKFAEISAEGQTIFEMKKISSGETATVELLLHGESVVAKILPVTEDGYVKEFETLNKFSVEKNGKLSSESFKLEPMPGMDWDEDSHKKFLELYPEGTIFGIEILNEDLVRLYQDGADIRPNLGGVKSTLNLSNTLEDKSETLDASEDLVIDFGAGGDPLQTKHSNEDIPETTLTTFSDQKSTETGEACDKEDLQDSGNVEAIIEKVVEAVKDKSNTETDSGHHSEQEISTDEAKAVTDSSNTEEDVPQLIDGSKEKETPSSEKGAIEGTDEGSVEAKRQEAEDSHTDRDDAKPKKSERTEDLGSLQETLTDEAKAVTDSSNTEEDVPQLIDGSKEKETPSGEKGAIEGTDEGSVETKRQEVEDSHTDRDDARPKKSERTEDLDSLQETLTDEAKAVTDSSNTEEDVPQLIDGSKEKETPSSEKGAIEGTDEGSVETKRQEVEDSHTDRDDAKPKKSERTEDLGSLKETLTVADNSKKDEMLQASDVSKEIEISSSEREAIEVPDDASLEAKQQEVGDSQSDRDDDAKPKKSETTKDLHSEQEIPTDDSKAVADGSKKELEVLEAGDVSKEVETPCSEKEITHDEASLKAKRQEIEVLQTDDAMPIEVAAEQNPKIETINEVAAKQNPKKEEPKTIVGQKSLEKEKSKTVAAQKSPKKEVPKTIAAQKSPKKEVPKTIAAQKSPKKEAPKTIGAKESPKEEEAKTIGAKKSPKKEEAKTIGAKESPKEEEAKTIGAKKSPKKEEAKTIGASKSPGKEDTTIGAQKISEKEDSTTIPEKEDPKTSEVDQNEVHSRPSSTEGRRISHDDRVVPAVYSAPHSPLPDDSEEKDERSEQKEERSGTPSEQREPYSRPSSAEGGRIKHDDRILPAVLSRPQTPIPDEPENN